MNSPYRNQMDTSIEVNVRSVNVVIVTLDDKEFDFTVLGSCNYNEYFRQSIKIDASSLLYERLKLGFSNGFLQINEHVLIPVSQIKLIKTSYKDYYLTEKKIKNESNI